MFIKRIRLHGFGRLTGACDFQPGRCNVLCQDNEFGKSTLMDAVLYAFYNFPTTGYKRTDLKPKERYRPWFAEENGGGESRGSFRVELELVDPDGRELLLQADFARQQPFELRDLNTHQAIPLDGTSFGKRYFRMPIQSFTECFFFRQDDREGPGRDDLIRVIEEAAASNQRQQPSSVRQAISALSEARLHLPEFSADAVQLETLVRRIDEKTSGVRVRLQELIQERDRRTGEISAAEKMDEQVRELEERRGRLELALLRAELTEVDVALEREAEIAAGRSRRAQILSELQPYALFDPAVRFRVEHLHAEFRSQQQRLDAVRNRLEKEIAAELENAEAVLAGFPAGLASLETTDLEQIRERRSVLAERRRQVENESRRVAELQEQMRSGGIPLEEIETVFPRIEAIPDVDRRCLLDSDGKRSAAESALSDVEKRVADSCTRVIQAKHRRGQLSTYAGAAAAGTASCLAIAIVLLLTRYTLAGSALLALTIIGGALSLWQISRRRENIIRTELQPAVAQEVTLNGESQRLREQLELLNSELADCMERYAVSEEDHQQFKAVSKWLQAALPYRAACLSQERSQAGLDEVLADTAAILDRITGYEEEDSREMQLDRLAGELLQHLDLRNTAARLREEHAKLQHEVEELERELAERQKAIADLVVEPLQSIGAETEVAVEDLIGAFFVGCEKAIQLQTTLAQPEPEIRLSPEEHAHCVQRRKELQEEWDQREKTPEDLPRGDRPQLQQELSRVEREREELRVRRINTFNDCDRAVEQWRREGPQLQEELDRLKRLRGEVVRYGEAVETAHEQLSSIADEVFRQWATGINERVNEILPLLNGRYRDVRCSNQLEISAFSVEAGRRLDCRELQHLSKGARDQLQLAVRIAVSEYLSAHVGHLPLVFDEPFAHWDDRRFIDGMRFLADLSQRHQVILLSCHHWRYEQLQSQEPELAARLHFCDLCDETLLV